MWGSKVRYTCRCEGGEGRREGGDWEGNKKDRGEEG